MENKFLCVMAGYDDDTENYLAGIQKKLYAVGLTGQHTKNIPQHITLQTYPTKRSLMGTYCFAQSPATARYSSVMHFS